MGLGAWATVSAADSHQDRDQEGYARLHLSAVQTTALVETETFATKRARDVFNFCVSLPYPNPESVVCLLQCWW